MQEDQNEGFYQEGDDSQLNPESAPHTENIEQDSMNPGETLVTWTASEYINNHKPATWYLGLLFVTALVAGAVFLFTSDLISSIVVVIVGVLFAVFAGRKPEVRTYELTTTGLMISDKLHPYGLFKSYAVHEENALRSIYLLPMKRFMPGITLYFPPEQEEKIIDTLNNYLPFEDKDPDAIDRLMNKIGF
jgi:hypothetical protein